VTDPKTDVDPTPSGGILAPPEDAEPQDRCVRCGKPTPAGVSLCDEHNPGRISRPSATQMHATILGGIFLGVIGFFLIARCAMTSSGPYETSVIEAIPDGSGGVAVAFSIVNEGDAEGVADCRVTRDGIPRPDDLAFRTDPLAGGDRTLVERVLPPVPEGSQPYVPDSISVICT
jgi:hypothetical protein